MKEELRKELLNDLIEFENGNKTLLMTFNKLFELACNQLDKLEAKDKEIEVLRNSHEMGANMYGNLLNQKSALHKEIADLKAKLERMKMFHEASNDTRKEEDWI